MCVLTLGLFNYVWLKKGGQFLVDLKLDRIFCAVVFCLSTGGRPL